MSKLKKNQEVKIYGKNACLMAFKHRPEGLIRAYLTQKNFFEFKKVLKYCTDHKLAYHIVSSEELDSISKSTHHEEVCFIYKRKAGADLSEILKSKKNQLILALEEVQNPHNLGAIMRTAAHFGVSTIIYKASVPVAQSAAAYRTAEGGAEALNMIRVDDWKEVTQLAAKNKYLLVGTSGHEGTDLFRFQFSQNMILFLGSEGPGISSELKKILKENIKIPGTDFVESLNVSNANTAILTEWYRQIHYGR